MQDLFLFVLIQVAASRYEAINSYTAFNCFCWLIGQMFGRRDWWPIIFCNTLALTGTFWASGWVLDTSFFVRMRDAHKMSMMKFWVGDAVLHWGPSVWLLWSLVGMREQWRQILRDSPEMKYCGLYSLLLNLLWAAQYRFEIGLVYVPNDVRTWYYMWSVCAGIHIGSGMLLAGI